MAFPLIPDISYPQFQPATRIITAITNGFPTVVTTNINHNYQTGLIIRLGIPENYGMRQANKLFGPITRINAISFSIEIDTTLFDPFIVPGALLVSTLAQAVPIAEDTFMLYQAVRDVMPNNILP